jgi:hypothetical protein
VEILRSVDVTLMAGPVGECVLVVAGIASPVVASGSGWWPVKPLRVLDYSVSHFVC